MIDNELEIRINQVLAKVASKRLIAAAERESDENGVTLTFETDGLVVVVDVFDPDTAPADLIQSDKEPTEVEGQGSFDDLDGFLEHIKTYG